MTIATNAKTLHVKTETPMSRSEISRDVMFKDIDTKTETRDKNKHAHTHTDFH